jgi:hypothetical protein
MSLGKSGFPRKHDTIFFYTKTDDYSFHLTVASSEAGLLLGGSRSHQTGPGFECYITSPDNPFGSHAQCKNPSSRLQKSTWLLSPNDQKVCGGVQLYRGAPWRVLSA